MTQNTWLSYGVLNPVAAANGNKSAFGSYGNEYDEPAWMAYTATPTHPLDGAAYVIELDVSGADSRIRSLSNYGNPTITDPGSTRSAGRQSVFIYIPSATTITAAVNVLGDQAFAGFNCNLNPDLSLDMVVAGFTYAGGTGGGTRKVLSKDQWYCLEAWTAYRDSAGNLLGHGQLVLRVLEGTGASGAWTAGAAPTTTVVVNAIIPNAYSSYGGTDLFTMGDALGPHASASASGKLYFCNAYSGLENADDPYGVIRAYHIPISADSGTDNLWLASGGGSKYADVDEWPFSDADNNSTVSTSTAGGGVKQAQVIPDISGTIAAADAVLSWGYTARMDFTAGGKGVGSNSHAYILAPGGGARWEGRTAADLTYSSSTKYGWKQAFDRAADGATKLAQTHMDTNDELEFGIRGWVASGGQVEYFAVHAILAWQKSGETTPALPPEPTMTQVPENFAVLPKFEKTRVVGY